jgi:hypothetical protein
MEFVVSKQGARCVITPAVLCRKTKIFAKWERWRAYGTVHVPFWNRIQFSHAQGKKLTDANLLNLLRFRIQYLDLSHCSALSMKSLEHLAELSSLSHLRPPRNVEPFTVTTLAVSRCSMDSTDESNIPVLHLLLKDCTQLIRRTWHEHPRNPGLSVLVDSGYQSAYHLLTWLGENGKGRVQLDIAFCFGCSHSGNDEKMIATQSCLYCSKYFCLRDRWECDMYDCKICERPSFCRDCFQLFQHGHLKYGGGTSPQVTCPFCKEGPVCSECYIKCYSCQKVQCDFCYEYGGESHEKCKICG